MKRYAGVVGALSMNVRMGLLAGGLMMAPVAQAAAQKIENPQISAKAGPNEGKRPAGWMVRSDSTSKVGSRDSVFLMNRGRGYELVSGPASIVWNPKNTARGSYIVESTLFSGRQGTTFPEGFGVFIGGRNMQTPNAEFTEFLIRNDGFYAVLHHVGLKTVKLKDWTRVAGINQHGGRRDESVRNTFRIIVDDQFVTMVVNRTLMTSVARADAKPDGEYGVRIGSKQLIQIETLGVEKPKK